MDERRRQGKTLAVSRVTRVRSGKILGGSDEGREEGEAWEETERSNVGKQQSTGRTQD